LDGKRLKFLVLGCGIVATMGGLLIVGMSRPGGVAYYLTVSEFVARPDREAPGLRVNGKVHTGSIERGASGQDVSFVMTDGASTLPVRYHGIIPDTFVDDADVVVEGGLGQDGTFEAHTLLAKCPSKYEAAMKAGEPMPDHENLVPRPSN
jgi:cytochrome c-type biogenesis protein CcmE